MADPTVNWVTGLIYVPKSYLTLVSGLTYRLDVDAFRLKLRDLEEDPDGRPWPKTHNHNGEATLSGVTYARVLTMLAPYTIEFEEGNYTIVCEGANHNIADVKVVNSVSLIIGNAAGLIVTSGGGALTPTESAQLAKIDYLEASVWVDTELADAGNGSQKTPFNTLSATIDYAEANGIRTIYVNADIVLDRSLKNFKFIGIGVPTVDCNGKDLTRSEFTHLALEGGYTGAIVVQDCSLINTFTLNGYFENCALSSTFTIPAGGVAFVKDCSSFTVDLTPPTFDIGTSLGTGKLILSGHRGGVEIINVNKTTDTVKVTDIVGRVIFDASDNNGAISLIGMGKVELNGATSTISDLMVDPDNIKITNQILQNKTETDPVTGIMRVYGDDGVTVLFTANIWENVAATTPYGGNAVNRRDRLS